MFYEAENYFEGGFWWAVFYLVKMDWRKITFWKSLLCKSPTLQTIKNKLFIFALPCILNNNVFLCIVIERIFNYSLLMNWMHLFARKGME